MEYFRYDGRGNLLVSISSWKTISLASVCLDACMCFHVYVHMSVGVLVQCAVLEKCSGVCGGLRDPVFMERPLNKQGLVGLSVHPA